MTQSDNELLPCPFCGPGNSIVESYFEDLSKHWKVGCGRCGGHSGAVRTREGAVGAWNSRNPAPCNKVMPADPQYLAYSQWDPRLKPADVVHDSAETPRTDAFLEKLARHFRIVPSELEDFARTLERELNALRAQSAPQPEPRRQEAKADGETPRTDSVRLRAGGLDNLEAAQEFEKLADSLERKLQSLMRDKNDDLAINRDLVRERDIVQKRYEEQVALTLEFSTKLDAALTQPSPKPSQGEWISVKDRLPAINHKALIAYADGSVGTKKIGKQLRRDDPWITHWQEYPAAPSTDSPTESSKEEP